jgi:dTDP-4-dehydrorhamnose 3,5-epimerase
MMAFEPTCVSDARLVRLQPISDMRGAFVRTWCADEFAHVGIPFRPVQANMSLTVARGTIRGMHFQRDPKAEAKVVRCTRGRIWDVITDLRRHSASRGASFGVELADGDARALYVPPGVAHGFQSLTDDAQVEYLMSEQYAPGLSDGFRYDDPAAAIAWPLPARMVSERDLAWPPLSTREFWAAAGLAPAQSETEPVT